jgi:hypothetical protein
MRILRRTLVFLLVLFWQGGFTFYALVVIPTGARVLGGHAIQANVTRALVPWLHAAGGVALLVLLWDTLAGHRTRLRLALLGCLLATLAAQVALAVVLDQAMDSPARVRGCFYSWHQAYLLVSGVQWLLFVSSVPLTLLAWRNEDRGANLPPLPSETPHLS